MANPKYTKYGKFRYQRNSKGRITNPLPARGKKTSSAPGSPSRPPSSGGSSPGDDDREERRAERRAADAAALAAVQGQMMGQGAPAAAMSPMPAAKGGDPYSAPGVAARRQSVNYTVQMGSSRGPSGSRESVDFDPEAGAWKEVALPSEPRVGYQRADSQAVPGDAGAGLWGQRSLRKPGDLSSQVGDRGAELEAQAAALAWQDAQPTSRIVTQLIPREVMQAAGVSGDTPEAYRAYLSSRLRAAQASGATFEPDPNSNIPPEVQFALGEAAGKLSPAQTGGAPAEALAWYATQGVGKIGKQIATGIALSQLGMMDFNSEYERKLALEKLAAGGANPLELMGQEWQRSQVEDVLRRAGLEYNPAAIKHVGQILGDAFSRGAALERDVLAAGTKLTAPYQDDQREPAADIRVTPPAFPGQKPVFESGYYARDVARNGPYSERGDKGVSGASIPAWQVADAANKRTEAELGDVWDAFETQRRNREAAAKYPDEVISSELPEVAQARRDIQSWDTSIRLYGKLKAEQQASYNAAQALIAAKGSQRVTTVKPGWNSEQRERENQAAEDVIDRYATRVQARYLAQEERSRRKLEDAQAVTSDEREALRAEREAERKAAREAAPPKPVHQVPEDEDTEFTKRRRFGGEVW